MNLTWSDNSWNDYLYWNQTDKQLFKKINTLIKEIKRTPFEGTGKPEPLKYELAGCWSRRLKGVFNNPCQHLVIPKIVS